MQTNLRSTPNLDVRALLARTWSDRLSPQQIDALAVQILSAQLDRQARLHPRWDAATVSVSPVPSGLGRTAAAAH